MTAQIINFNRRRLNASALEDHTHAGAVLMAISAGRGVNLVRALSDIDDRAAFFSAHYADIAAAICDRGDGDILYALLKLGFPMKGEFMEWICRSGQVELLQVARECTLRSRSPGAARASPGDEDGFRMGME